MAKILTDEIGNGIPQYQDITGEFAPLLGDKAPYSQIVDSTGAVTFTSVNPGKVSISNWPVAQPINGSVSVSNFPNTQQVSGAVSVSNLPSTQDVRLMGSSLIQKTVSIANGASLSSAVDLGNEILVGYIMPAAWTSTTVTFQTSPDGIVAYSDIYDSTGTEISHTVAASRFVRVNPGEWAGVQFLKVRSGTAGTPINQGAVRTITLVTKAV